MPKFQSGSDIPHTGTAITAIQGITGITVAIRTTGLTTTVAGRTITAVTEFTDTTGIIITTAINAD